MMTRPERERKLTCPRAGQPDTSHIYTHTSARQSGQCPCDPLNSACPLSDRRAGSSSLLQRRRLGFQSCTSVSTKAAFLLPHYLIVRKMISTVDRCKKNIILQVQSIIVSFHKKLYNTINGVLMLK